MNERPTPETDAFSVKFKSVCGSKAWVPTDICRRFERERDKARDKYNQICSQTLIEINKAHEERDEAREVLREIAEASGFDNIGNWARNKARKEIDRYREKNDLLPISWDV